jgi:UDP-GlcNAc:undecaprenyl-phosphate/decaprenyl-phosphate GlcNAc-1-phosphate transferase
MNILVIWGLVAFCLSAVSTVFVKQLALKKGAVDVPKDNRRLHKQPIARLGGLAIFLSVLIVVAVVLATSDALTGGEITRVHYIGVVLGGLILMIGGYLDDRFDLPPKFAIVAPVLAALTVILFGIEVDKLSNPFGDVLVLETWQSNILVFVWLMVIIYTTKFLDGVDGLATSVSGVGVAMIMLISLTAAYFQPDVALLSAISLGAFAGFLLWNFHPATIFLGEGGSTFVGFLLGVLAVISGGKLAIALLVLGIPILDLIWIVLRRVKTGGLKSAFKGDRKHLHHRLYDLGLSQKAIVYLYVFIASAFGVTALFLQSKEKLVALVILCIMMLAAILFFIHKERYDHT